MTSLPAAEGKFARRLGYFNLLRDLQKTKKEMLEKRFQSKGWEERCDPSMYQRDLAHIQELNKAIEMISSWKQSLLEARDEYVSDYRKHCRGRAGLAEESGSESE